MTFHTVVGRTGPILAVALLEIHALTHRSAPRPRGQILVSLQITLPAAAFCLLFWFLSPHGSHFPFHILFLRAQLAATITLAFDSPSLQFLSHIARFVMPQ